MAPPFTWAAHGRCCSNWGGSSHTSEGHQANPSADAPHTDVPNLWQVDTKSNHHNLQAQEEGGLRFGSQSGGGVHHGREVIMKRS